MKGITDSQIKEYGVAFEGKTVLDCGIELEEKTMGIYVKSGKWRIQKSSKFKIYVDKTMLPRVYKPEFNLSIKTSVSAVLKQAGNPWQPTCCLPIMKRKMIHALFKPYRISKDSSFEEHITNTMSSRLTWLISWHALLLVEEMIDYLQRRDSLGLKKHTDN